MAISQWTRWQIVKDANRKKENIHQKCSEKSTDNKPGIASINTPQTNSEQLGVQWHVVTTCWNKPRLLGLHVQHSDQYHV